MADARQKIKPLKSLERIVHRAKAKGRSVVFTNGCFDLLHPGHIQLLERAKRLGDLLVVAINSDRSVRMLKGPRRPIINQRDRALLVAALESVDYVTMFNEPTPALLIDRLRPQVLVKGADWSATRIVGRETIRRNHGRVVRIPLIKGQSTTQLIERIRSAAGGEPLLRRSEAASASQRRAFGERHVGITRGHGAPPAVRGMPEPHVGILSGQGAERQRGERKIPPSEASHAGASERCGEGRPPRQAGGASQDPLR